MKRIGGVMDNPLATTRKLSKRQLAQLKTFTDPSVILDTLLKNNWTVEDSIVSLIEIAKGSGKESVKLGAIKYLNQLLLDATERAGLMVVAKSRGIGPSGEEITFTGHVVSKSLRSQKESLIVEPVITSIEEITPVIVEAKNAQEKDEKNQENQENQEENKEETENSTAGGDGDDSGATEDRDIDMSVCKPPTGAHAEAQFGGIATAHSGSSDTIHIL
jgi:hypothetical protein